MVLVRRSRFKRRRRRRRKPAVKNVVRRVRRLEKSREFKLIDTQVGATAQGVVPTIVQLTNIVQGLTDITRMGTKITITGIQLRYIANDDITNGYRMMVIMDRQTNGVIYTAADLLEDVTTTDVMISPLNRDNKGRFKVLYDRLHLLSVAGVANVQGRRFFRMNTEVRFDGNAGDISDLTTNSYSLLHVAQIASMNPTIFVRLFFTDN